MEPTTKNTVNAVATEKQKKPEEDEVPFALTLLPLCDVAGYACFVAWAFAVGWDKGISSIGAAENSYGFYFLRCALFLGVALAMLLLFLMGGSAFLHKKGKVWGAIGPLLCSACAVTFYIPLPYAVVVFCWFLAGVGQSVSFFLWGSRFRVLTRKQQLYTVCGSFAIGGLSLSLFPFIDPTVVVFTVTLLPIASYALLLVAYRQYAGEENTMEARRFLPSFSGGIRSLRKQIPFEEDRRFIILKGLFALLYSISLGFVTCAALADWFYPVSEVVIGFGNAIAAMIMVATLKDHERTVCNALPKLFLPVTSFCYLFLGTLWPTPGILACAAVIFILFGCYEIMNAHTAYAYSSYDAVRCLWELNSSKAGNGIGFFLGWTFATASLYVFAVDTSALLVLCLILVTFAVVIDTALFKEMKLEFREIIVDNEATLEVLDPKTLEILTQGRGRWARTCDELSDQYKLSPRQKEIFLLLAKGRNVQFIKDELVLSTPTVKSHIYNIYQKMGIHSHQELLDLVENGAKGE